MKAILVVSFGTTHVDTREKTIDKIEEDIENTYQEYKIYRAFTSQVIIGIIKRKYNKKIFNVREALDVMLEDGITEIIVQPTHILNGIENDLMLDCIDEYANKFEKVAIGNPLLTSHDDNCVVLAALVSEFSFVSDDTAVVLMGHGSEHFAGNIYAAVDYQFKRMGHKNFFIATVDGYPQIDIVLEYVKSSGFKKVLLAPFMIVAGDHAKNDLIDNDNSFKALFLQNGFEVECYLKGLGEYEQVRQLFIRHIADVMG